MAKDIIMDFETWGDFLQYVTPEPKGDASLPTASRSNDLQFTKTHNFKEALDLAYSGWKEGAEKVKKISEPIFLHVSSLVERHDVTHDVEGIQVDIARYLDNEPECWLQWEPKILENPGTKILRLIFNGSVSSGISTSVIERCGAVVTALVELLEYSGIRVEIFMQERFKNHSSCEVTSQVKLKSADQPLDVPRISFAFGHPSSLRRLQFSFLEQQSDEHRREIGFMYGQPQPASMKGDIVIPELHLMNRRIQTPEDAEKWIIEQLKLQSVELKSK